MPDNIPFEIQVEIIKRLPVKLLIQFRSVCKAWKSQIDCSNFIANYSGQHRQLQHLLVSYQDPCKLERKYVSIVDDDTFPLQKASLTPPPLVSMLGFYSIVGSSHGLLCLLRDYPYGREVVVLWNISIRKAVVVILPNIGSGIYSTELGFGVCREKSDPKIIKINQIRRHRDVESITCIPWQVEVFPLSSRAWRTPYSSHLPRKSIEFSSSQVVADGFVYWLAADRFTVDGVLRSKTLIMSFDFTSEEFKEVNLPHCLAHQHVGGLSIKKLRDSLVVLDYSTTVWMMEDGVPKSFTKLFTIDVDSLNESLFITRGFRKTGVPIIEIEDQYGVNVALAVYEPYSKHIKNLGINGEISFSVYPYMETLLLLDQPDFAIYNDNGNGYIASLLKLYKQETGFQLF